MADVAEKTTTTTTTTTTGTTPKTRKAPGLSFRRYFTQPDISPYDALEWELRTAQITDAEGNIIFEQKDVEVPKDWSMTATNIAASKYLHGCLGTRTRKGTSGGSLRRRSSPPRTNGRSAPPGRTP